MNSALFPDDKLDQMRTQGDPLADDLVDFILRDRDPQRVLDFLQAMIRIPKEEELEEKLQKFFPDPAVQEKLRDFLGKSAQPPEWLDPAQLALGAELFREQVFLSFIVLACASLPTAYSAMPDVKILGITGGLDKNIPRRIPETAQMLVDVLGKGGIVLRDGRLMGAGVRSLQKVRLMHALVRRIVVDDEMRDCLCDAVEERVSAAGKTAHTPEMFLQTFLSAVSDIQNPEKDNDSGRRWDPEKDGVPINQETLAGTLLTFSHIILKGLKRIGINVEAQEETGFLHCWDVAGHVLGIDDYFTTRLTSSEACESLYQQILRRRCHPDAPNAQGRELEQALLDYIEANQVRLLWFAKIIQLQRSGRLTTFMLVDKPVRQALKIHLSLMDWIVLPIMWFGLRLFGFLKNQPWLKHIAQGVFRWISRRVWSWRVIKAQPALASTPGQPQRGVEVPEDWLKLPKKKRKAKGGA